MNINLTDFIKPELLVLVPVLYLAGAGLKKSEIKDKFIPALLGLFGIILAVLWVLGTTDLTAVSAVMQAIFVAITQGLLCAGASVYVNQLVKQSKEE